MFLKKLTIKNGDEIIREIHFHKGVNFIVDSSQTSDKNIDDSGNNVGKTTTLRLVDYCLGSTGKDIYSDTEFRQKNNTDIKRFLTENNIFVELVLTADLDDELATTITITRNFLSHKRKIITFNGVPVNIDSLKSNLSLSLFNNGDSKPPFRNLIAKFIRDTSYKMSMTLRYLHQTTTLPEYEALHLFLLGIRLPDSILLEKQLLLKKVSAEQKILDRLTDYQTENGLIQALEIIHREIESLEQKKGNYSREQLNDGTIEQINQLKIEISRISEDLGNKELRLKLAYDSLNELKSGIKDYDVDAVRQIYSNAKALLPNLQTRFEDVVSFHQSMLNNKIKYILNEIEPISVEISSLKKELNDKVTQEVKLTNLLNTRLSLSEYDTIVNDLNNRYELKGSRTELLRQIQDLKKVINECNARLTQINAVINSAEENLVKNEIVFNKYFSSLSKELYSEEFYLSHSKREQEDVYYFEIDSIESNLGGGKKKGQIAAFDLAYIDFCNEMKIAAPKFVLHDSTEDVSYNQLIKIVQYSKNLNGQYILAILKEKFANYPEGQKLIDENKVIELGQSDKLFKYYSQEHILE